MMRPWRPPGAARGCCSSGRGTDGRVEVLIGHMGGPFWARKHERAWSIPKGEHPPDEEPWAAARREFAEETGLPVPDGEPVPLGTVRQSGGKEVTVWAVEGDLDATAAVSNTFSLEWPRGSGTLQEFPELDRFAWARRRRRARPAGRRARPPSWTGWSSTSASPARPRRPSLPRGSRRTAGRLAITAAAVTPSTVIANSEARTPAVALFGMTVLGVTAAAVRWPASRRGAPAARRAVASPSRAQAARPPSQEGGLGGDQQVSRGVQVKVQANRSSSGNSCTSAGATRPLH